MMVQCPNCGAPVEFKAGSSVIVVCGNCSFAVVRTDRDIRTVGRVADLAKTDSPLRLGLSGTYRGLRFTIVGRQQLDHGQGPWDEWYCTFSDGRWGWLAEAQGRYYLTWPAPPPQAPIDYLSPGMPIPVMQTTYTVAEKGTGRLVAAAGELPVAFVPGGWFRYIDLSAGNGQFATLDYGAGDGSAPEEAYVGYVVPFEELGLPTDLGAKREAISGGEKGAGAKPSKGKALSCPNCGGNIDVRAPGTTKRVACPFCSSLLDASQGELKWLEVVEQQKTIPKLPM